MIIENLLENVNIDAVRHKAYNFVRENFVPTWDSFKTDDDFIKFQNKLDDGDLRFVNFRKLIYNKTTETIDGAILSVRNDYDLIKFNKQEIVDYIRKKPFAFDSGCCGGQSDNFIESLQNQIALVGYNVETLEQNRIFNYLKDRKFSITDIKNNDLVGLMTPLKLKQVPTKLRELLEQYKSCSGSCKGCSGDCSRLEIYLNNDEIEFNPAELN